MDIPTEEQARYFMEKALRVHKKVEPKKLEKDKYYYVIPVFNSRYIGTVSDETNKMKRIWQYNYGDFEKVNDKVNIDGAAAYFEIPEKFFKIEPVGFTTYDPLEQERLRLIPKLNLGAAVVKSKQINYNSDSNNNNNNSTARTASFRNKKERRHRRTRKTRRYQRR